MRQTKNGFYTVYVSLIAALGGFLMGFDASVISGVVKFIEPEFQLSKIELGWAVASLSLTATLAMMLAGPLSDKFGRKALLKIAALLFSVSAVASALAPDYLTLVLARMLGGLGVGAALILAPMYIAEIAPAKQRGRMVSLNQLNIVIGISVAFFTNFLILRLGDSDAAWTQTLHLAEWNWRWMLGIELLPALLYWLCLHFVPESPRWLVMQGRQQEAEHIMQKSADKEQLKADLAAIYASLEGTDKQEKVAFGALFRPAMRLVIFIGVSIAVLQQITGINAVFFYAPMIFEQAGLGTDAAFMQAVFVGLTNLVFTLLAFSLIDSLGRKPLLIFGASGIALSMLCLSFGFHSATYKLTEQSLQALPDQAVVAQLAPIAGKQFDSDLAFNQAIGQRLNGEQFQQQQPELIKQAIKVNQTLVLFGLLGFVACFAMSLGPVMWVLFTELFPNRIRGLAMSFVGLINSAVSFLVQLLFPWELANFGNAPTFLLFALFALIGLVIIIKYLPETKGKSLEELEARLGQAGE